MGLSQPRQIFGVHTFAPYKRSNKKPYGAAARVLKNSSFQFSGELVQSTGGASKFPWAVEESSANAEISLSMEEYPDWAFEIFAGKAPTVDAAGSATGSVSALTNTKGTSIADGTAGVASVTALAGSEADLKFGKYIIEAVDADSVNVYALSDVDFNRGTAKEFIDDSQKINSAPIDLTGSGSTHTIAGFGLEITAGSAVSLALEAGDTAIFEVMPPYKSKLEVKIGGTSDVFPEFGAIMVAQQRGNGELFEVDAYRCKGIGLPIGLQEKTFSAPEVTAQAFYDAVERGVAGFRWVEPT